MPRQGKKTGERGREETGRMEGRDSVLSTPHGGASACLRTGYWGDGPGAPGEGPAQGVDRGVVPQPVGLSLFPLISKANLFCTWRTLPVSVMRL